MNNKSLKNESLIKELIIFKNNPIYKFKDDYSLIKKEELSEDLHIYELLFLVGEDRKEIENIESFIENFHKLIDSKDNDEMFKNFYDYISNSLNLKSALSKINFLINLFLSIDFNEDFPLVNIYGALTNAYEDFKESEFELINTYRKKYGLEEANFTKKDVNEIVKFHRDSIVSLIINRMKLFAEDDIANKRFLSEEVGLFEYSFILLNKFVLDLVLEDHYSEGAFADVLFNKIELLFKELNIDFLKDLEKAAELLIENRNAPIDELNKISQEFFNKLYSYDLYAGPAVEYDYYCEIENESEEVIYDLFDKISDEFINNSNKANYMRYLYLNICEILEYDFYVDILFNVESKIEEYLD